MVVMNRMFEVRIAQIEAKRKRQADALQRRIKMGYIKNISEFYAPHSKGKGIKNWYTTRQLAEKVEEGLERTDGNLRINGKWNLQIRGKHMRRLKKKMKIKQVGRYIVRNEE
jgi:hypothetical protein